MDWIKEKMGEASTEIAGYFVVAAILAIGAAIWAMALSWAGPLVIVLVLGILGLGLLIPTQLYNIRESGVKVSLP